MDRLWAPWRMEYIENIDKPGCFLCDVSSTSEKDDRRNLVLYRGEESFVVLNKYPYNAGHLMVAPYEHTANMLSLSAGCRDEMLLLCAKAMDVLTENLGSQGFNCGMNFGRVAGAGIQDHLHLHVVPRWVGDMNFFPVLAETKSMPEYLEKTYEKLVSSFANLR